MDSMELPIRVDQQLHLNPKPCHPQHRIPIREYIVQRLLDHRQVTVHWPCLHLGNAVIKIKDRSRYYCGQ